MRLSIWLAFLILGVSAVANFRTPYESSTTSSPTISQILLQGLLFVPFFVFALFRDWNFKEFGFLLNPRAALSALLIVGVLVPSFLNYYNYPLIGVVEGFARFGEELFFRGFLFVLVAVLFRGRSKPWLWATIISSACFALVHTQVFQPTYFSAIANGTRFFLVAQRLVNVFLAGMALALLRHWSRSLLPPIVVHTALNGGLIAIAVGVVMFGAFLVWAIVRNERVMMGMAISREEQ